MGMTGAIRRARDAAGREQGSERGQSTVELVAALPILLAVALIVVNATLFLSECAAFDRLAPQAVRVHAASPAYGQDVSAGKDLVQRQLEAAFPEENLSVEVAVRETAGGMLSFDATLRFSPRCSDWACALRCSAWRCLNCPIRWRARSIAISRG